ncbi:methyltransferase family protein [Natranaerovirga hydrolytica]|uniref:Methyltransferase family protein n=1 Tax=Natranaerovirga hydrolytica TaxID=680378 RepID=A0A4R1MJK2_9FIRM|nr:class I SAM-dependent methyltransferase [Natranaerovirga hydrolytica]TCK92677.1 methyltransferase family protein [Natranaerovirga hydrolytica]
MKNKELRKYWLLEEQRSFKGWDFSYIKNRTVEEPLPWDYDKIIRQHLKTNHIVLDMGTGGGEYLLTLKHPYTKTYVTEGYPPNVALCNEKLTPLGITVKQVFGDNKLPFKDGMFDIIINRHESFDINEVHRLLKPKGLFVTQQVGGLNNKELSKFLIKGFREIISSGYTLENTQVLIKSKGFSILKAEEYFPRVKFLDVGSLVYLAKIIEWEFPNFSVEKCFEQLCALHSTIEKQGFVESKQHRFIIVSQKIKA